MANDSAGKERRRFARVALDAHVAVTVVDTDTLFESRIRDLSENGVFILTKATRPLGTNIRLTISVGDGELGIEAKGIIVHEVTPETATEKRPAGIGVMFIEVAERSLAALRKLVAAGEPLP